MKDVQQTSITAYNEDVRSGKIPSQRKRIEEIIKIFGPISRREIREKCRIEQFWKYPDIPMTSVCGRVRCLLDSDLIHVCDTKIDPTTGKTVQILAYGPEQKLNGNQYEFQI